MKETLKYSLSTVLFLVLLNEVRPAALPDKKLNLQPTFALETWGSLYRVGNQPGGISPEMQFRRIRAGVRGSLDPNITFNFSFYLDHFRPLENDVRGQMLRQSGLWQAILGFKLIPESQLLNLYAGYFCPPLGQASLQTVWSLPGLDKTFTSAWYRRVMTLKGSGNLPGLALGGKQALSDRMALSYRMGIHHIQDVPSEPGFHPLYSAHLRLILGDEAGFPFKYKLPGKHTKGGKGLALGLGTSHKANFYSLGGDLAVFHNNTNLSGEFYLVGTRGYEWSACISRFMRIRECLLEPALSFSGLSEYALYEETDQALNTLGTSLGMNCYLLKNRLRLGLHYLRNDSTEAFRESICASIIFRI